MASISAFVNWAKDNGIKSPHVDVAETEYAGHGLLAKESISNDGMTLVHIPHNMLITATRAIKNNLELCEALSKIDEEDLETFVRLPQQERFTLRLFLALQKFSSKQKSSFWKPYIDVLPSLDDIRKTSILFLDDEGSRTLDGTGLSMPLRAKRMFLKQELEVVKTAVEWMTFDMWLWANAIFWSRAISVGSSNTDDLGYDTVLLPFFDFANHSMDPTIRWEPTKDGGIDLVPFPDAVGSLAGNELFLSYGDDKPNQELLYLYGFTLDGNPVSSKMTAPFANFFDMQDPASQVKISWVSQLKRPVVTLSAPLKEEETGWDSTGWTRDSLAMMYIAALEDDIMFELLPDVSNLTLSEKSNKTSDDEDDPVMIQASLEGEVIDTLDSLAIKVAKSEQFPLIELRVVILLMNLLEGHIDEISSAIPAQKVAPSMADHIERYKKEELQVIQTSYTALEKYRDQLMEHEYVVAYIAAQE
ncbi:hypothetical protein BJV82DRAFT_631327 [Fennellomyces sp. T-0311]|nr:hypothetical protein BJV82DRAFT_631327 [Fennellomyces sp. T-0311]